ncbi:SDR family NAD(P)-dependent oxidoreductase [Leucobacter sp. HY1910]
MTQQTETPNESNDVSAIGDVDTRGDVNTGSDVSGRVVVITGGGTGIGAAIAERYVSEGARVVIVGRRPGPLEETAARTGATPIVADAADGASARAAVAQVIEKFGRIDVLVANAGGHGFSAVGDTSDDDWESSIKANLSTAFVMTREALPELRRSAAENGSAGSQIVIVSSLAGLFAGPSVAGYTVGKHALVGLTRSLARDYSRLGVRTNAICPGWVRTPMADAEMDEFAAHAAEITGREAGYAAVTADVPLGRPAEPAEIASIVRFLGSRQSSYITGAVIVADGGAHIVDLPTLAFEHAGM